MVNNRLIDELAQIRYRLRHEAITDELVEWLETVLETLRSKYRRNNSEFRSEDILFLKQLASLIPTLSSFLAFQRQLVILKRGPHLIQELSNLNESIEQMQEDSFSLISKQLEALRAEIDSLYQMPNIAVKRDALDARPLP